MPNTKYHGYWLCLRILMRRKTISSFEPFEFNYLCHHLEEKCCLYISRYASGDFYHLRTVPPFVTAHTFCAYRDIRVS